MESEYIKKFDEWNNYSKIINQRNPPLRFSEREVWWCSLGVNIGSEEDGKNDSFERPVLILSKINRNIVIVVPLTSQIYDHEMRFDLYINESRFQIQLLQIRSISTKRLHRKVVEIKLFEYLRILAILGVYFISKIYK